MDSEAQRALGIALKMLHASDKFEAEIVARLKREGCSEDAVAFAVGWVRNKKISDDIRLTHELVAKLLTSGTGAELVRQKLLARGAPEAELDAALAAADDERQLEGIRTLLGRKRRPNSTRTQMARMLAARGFDQHLVEPELDKVFGESEEPP